MEKPESRPLITPETEQEIRDGVQFIFEHYFGEPNTKETWEKLRDHINDFLFRLWEEGKLLGGNPERAFQVHVGVGPGRAGEDVAQGRIRVRITLPDERGAVTEVVLG